MASYTLDINNKQYQIDVDPQTPLLWVVRDHIGLKGTKFGFGFAQCGACTIHLSGNAIFDESKNRIRTLPFDWNKF